MEYGDVFIEESEGNSFEWAYVPRKWGQWKWKTIGRRVVFVGSGSQRVWGVVLKAGEGVSRDISGRSLSRLSLSWKDLGGIQIGWAGGLEELGISGWAESGRL